MLANDPELSPEQGDDRFSREELLQIPRGSFPRFVIAETAQGELCMRIGRSHGSAFQRIQDDIDPDASIVGCGTVCRFDDQLFDLFVTYDDFPSGRQALFTAVKEGLERAMPEHQFRIMTTGEGEVPFSLRA